MSIYTIISAPSQKSGEICHFNWRHQAITYNKVDFVSVTLCSILLSAILQRLPPSLFTIMRLKVVIVKLSPKSIYQIISSTSQKCDAIYHVNWRHQAITLHNLISQQYNSTTIAFVTILQKGHENCICKTIPTPTRRE